MSSIFLQTTLRQCGQVDESATSGTRVASPPASSQLISTAGSGLMGTKGD